MAVTLTATALRLKLGLPDPTAAETAAGLDRAAELLGAASEIVTNYAAKAPDAIANESVFRIAGFLHNRAAAAPDSITAGGIRLNWRPMPGRNVLRQSGAMGLLAPWHRPRALVIE